MDYLFEIFGGYVVIAVLLFCLCVGFIIKHLIPSDAVNRFIPLIMAVLGIFFNLWMNAWALTWEVVIGGMVSGLASTGAYELFRNIIEKWVEKFYKRE